MPAKYPRLAVRAVIVHEGRLLLVNAWPDGKSTLMCAPGGGVDPGASLPENLAREVFEETGLRVAVHAPCLVNEFHDPRIGFHQVEVFFRCSIIGETAITEGWQDPESIVTKHVWANRAEMSLLKVKPDSLARIAFTSESGVTYDPLEMIVM
jgi:8-oxo-dGTP pyrophosphatase MutT (NUDIX family)